MAVARRKELVGSRVTFWLVNRPVDATVVEDRGLSPDGLRLLRVRTEEAEPLEFEVPESHLLGKKRIWLNGLWGVVEYPPAHPLRYHVKWDNGTETDITPGQFEMARKELIPGN